MSLSVTSLVRDRLNLMLCRRDHLLELLVNSVHFLIRHVAEIDHHIPGMLVGADKLIVFQVKRTAIPVLRKTMRNVTIIVLVLIIIRTEIPNASGDPAMVEHL